MDPTESEDHNHGSDSRRQVNRKLILHVPSGERRSGAQGQQQGSLTAGACSPQPRANGTNAISPLSAVGVWTESVTVVRRDQERPFPRFGDDVNDPGGGDHLSN